jgi:1,2-diacylglycerol 3-beta-galactosyltransferase
MQKKHLFLYLKTGGGHLAPARSIANYINVKHGDRITPVLADGFQGVNKWIRYFIEDGYRFSQSKAIWIFESLYALNKIRWIGNALIMFLSFLIRPHLEKQILSNSPSKIVIFHFFLIKPVLQILSKNKLKIPVTVVVTDPFTAHPFWFLEKTPKFIVFSEKLKLHSIKKGIHPDHISVFPFILDEKFAKPLNPVLSHSIKRNLGFDTGKRLVLILGGGDGIPKGKKILNNFLKNNSGAQIAIVCGNNQNLYKKAWKLKSKYNSGDLKIYGYVDFIYELINIADVVVTKCGASTFMEILMSGKIPVISNYIWEQEKGNMEFVRDNSLGLYEKKTSVLPLKVNEIIYNPHIARVYKNNIEIMSLKNGTPLVSDFIVLQ